MTWRDMPVVACKTCGRLTDCTGIRLCRLCWEVECRLSDYLQSAVGREIVRAALAKANAPVSP